MSVDKLQLYRWAVQDPATHVAVLSRMYAAIRPGHEPRVLREDFAGTSAEAVEWVRRGEQREAVAIDLDGPTLAWAARRAERLLGARARQVKMIEGDVMQVAPPDVPAADIISALNFSILYFHERSSLEGYFRHARRSLAEGGLLVMNLFGGAEAARTYVDKRQIEPTLRGEEPIPPPFEYRWEQRNYNAITGRIDCRIHFTIDGTTLNDAFTYNWRLWTLPELIDALRSAGFADVQVWRHTYDPQLKPHPVFLGPVHAIGDAATWLAYVVATG